jgi:predicted amidohydrolase YtcJ
VILAAHPAYILNTAAQNQLKDLYKGEPAGYPDDWDDKGFANMGVEYRREVVVDGYFGDKTEELAGLIETGLLQNAAAGITTFSSHVMGIQNFDAYMHLWRNGRMPIRFGFTHYTGFVMNQDAEGFYRRLGDMFQLGDDYLWFAGIGVGQLDHGPPLFCSSIVPEAEAGRTGYEWCRNEPGGQHHDTMITALANGSRVVAGHNYGDKSADFYMDIIEEAMRRNPAEITLEHIRSLRLSADHGGLYPRPDQLPRIKNLGMMLSMGTQGMSRSLPWIQKWGFEKYEGWVVPIRRTLDAGIKVAWEGEGGWKDGIFGRLWTPFITRTNRQGVVVAADQAIDRNTLLKMATAWGSEFVLKEDKIGSLEVGKLADFLILNQDYMTVTVEQMNETFPMMTVVGGEIVYLRDEFARELGMPASPLQIRFRFEEDSGAN